MQEYLLFMDLVDKSALYTVRASIEARGFYFLKHLFGEASIRTLTRVRYLYVCVFTKYFHTTRYSVLYLATVHCSDTHLKNDQIFLFIKNAIFNSLQLYSSVQ